MCSPEELFPAVSTEPVTMATDYHQLFQVALSIAVRDLSQTGFWFRAAKTTDFRDDPFLRESSH